MDNREKNTIKNKYFGTDGFRGEFGRELLPNHAFLIGRFLGWYFGERLGISCRILVGKDTRKSSSALETSLVRGIIRSGGEAYLLGVATTPALSYLAEANDFDAAVMITASHNPFYDNGIKILNCHGEKLDEETTALLESYMDGDLSALGIDGDDLPLGEGASIDFCGAVAEYRCHLIRVAESLSGVRIGLDCANGAAYKIAPDVFKKLGAEIHLIGCSPDGENINRGIGSTHTDALAALVRNHGLDMGFAFDGDGDRCIGIDATGEVIDGDREMLILAKWLKGLGELSFDTLVTTVMSNKGLFSALAKNQIKCEITPVGDRFVWEKMMAEDYSLGGEQSGHIIIRKHASTGDGILTALCLATIAHKEKKSLAELSEELVVFPQLTENIPVKDKESIINDPDVRELYRQVSDEIGDDGRILLRCSGTESLIRIMVEHKNIDKCKHYVDITCTLIKKKDEML